MPFEQTASPSQTIDTLTCTVISVSESKYRFSFWHCQILFFFLIPINQITVLNIRLQGLLWKLISPIKLTVSHPQEATFGELLGIYFYTIFSHKLTEEWHLWCSYHNLFRIECAASPFGTVKKLNEFLVIITNTVFEVVDIRVVRDGDSILDICKVLQHPGYSLFYLGAG